MTKDHRSIILKELSSLLALFTIPLLSMSLYRYFSVGFMKVMIVHVICAALFLTNYFLLNKIKPIFNYLLLIFILNIIGISTFLNQKDILAGQWSIMSALILSALFLNFSSTLTIFIFNVILEYVIAIFYLKYLNHFFIIGSSTIAIVMVRAIYHMRNKLEESAVLAEKSKELAFNSLKSKEMFFSSMTHELRTPLHGIINGVDLIKETQLNQSQREIIEVVDFSNKILLNVINDILDISKLKQNKIDLNITEINLKKVIKKTMATHELSAKNKGIELIEVLNIDDNLFINSDDTRIIQILNNLIGNSIKFTETGFVKLEVNIEDKFINNKLNVHFSISDSGMGIKKEYLANIFMPFTQEDASIVKKYGGTGLGLAISKELVELFGGLLSVSSKFGVGTEFNFTIPTTSVIHIEKASNLSNSLIDLPHLFSKYNTQILIAEDNQINQTIINLMLSKEGAKVDFAQNGEEVLKMIEEKSYDIIFMDMQMPILDGIETTKIIRSNQNTKIKNIFIIACSANLSNYSEEQMITLGMDAGVPKPLNKANLQQAFLKYFTPFINKE